MIFAVFHKYWVLGYSLSNKTWWKPRFPMDYRPLVEGRIANFVIFLDVSDFLRFLWIFLFFKKIRFLGILGPPSYGIGATIRIGQEMLCVLYAGFSKLSISRNVRPCVCVFVCSLLKYRLNIFLPPLPEVGCPIFLEIRNSWGKSSGKKWSHIWTFLFENFLKSPSKKKLVFGWFCLTKHGRNHTSRWIRDHWSKGVLLILAYL